MIEPAPPGTSSDTWPKTSGNCLKYFDMFPIAPYQLIIQDTSLNRL